jgi:hypothetical protein
MITKEIPAFRKFLEARGFKCRDGKGDWQSLQVQNITDRGWKAFCHNAKGVVTSPVEFDALIQLFHAPVDPAPSVEVVDRPASHDSDLLDDFAIAAMQAMASGSFNDPLGDKQLALRSYGIALAMMAERAKHQPK